MSLLELVEELEDLIEASGQIPLTGKAMIDRDEFLEIVTEMKEDFPEELREAKKICADRGTIMQSAQSEAERIINGAKAHAEEIISENQLVKQANERANEILRKANDESLQIREGARDYADQLLENTQVKLSEIIKMLNENRQELRG
ncbi:ATPase [Anaerosphaera multitolerans]|uniref:ATPase n=1 Tax=Anaerosphaera multitolerans TaxID=2487351 RepID=A0A437S768_9FIRM|nr:ATPase [Anaerosphaera multitolerans]RVU54895.1 ATPase [Anaerosphaera multitolerans]